MSTASLKDFRIVRKIRISEEIIEQVRDLIVSGRLRPGDRLPSERELAQILHVGRSTVREAIRAMESMSLVKVRAGEGTFLVSLDGNPEANSLAGHVLKSWDNQHQLFEVRRVIEPDLASLAARRATPQQLEEMRATLQAQAAAVERGENGMQADTRFHFLLAEAAGNDVLMRLMTDLMEMLQETRAHSLEATGRPATSLRQHRAVLRAIQAREPKAAERRMLEHLRDMENLVFAAQEWPGPAATSAGGAS